MGMDVVHSIPKTPTMRMKFVISSLLFIICLATFAQQSVTDVHSHSIENETAKVEKTDSFPKPIPILLPPQQFIPISRMEGLQPWLYAPMTRPEVVYIPTIGFNGGEGFGEYFQQHPDKFFSNFLSRNVIDLPHLYVTRQMMIGNTLRLDKKGRVYFLSGIVYGSQMGLMGNNWGMGTKEGILIKTKSGIAIVIWNQNFQSVTVYSPVIFPRPDGSSAAIIMPATPEVFSIGVQASFVSGEFIIDIGASVSPVPFQKRKHSEFRYK